MSRRRVAVALGVAALFAATFLGAAVDPSSASMSDDTDGGLVIPPGGGMVPPMHPTFALLNGDAANVLSSGRPVSTLTTCDRCNAACEHQGHGDRLGGSRSLVGCRGGEDLMAIKPVGPSVRKGKAPNPRPFPNPYLVGVGLGVVLFLSVLITGDGLGAPGAVQRIWAWIENLVAPQHVDTNIYLVRYAGGEAQPLNHWIVMLAIGVLIGGFISGLIGRRVYTEIVKGPLISNRTRLLFALLGGSFVGFGARFARGCTSSQGLTGSALLSVGSWVFMMAFFAGALAAAPFFKKLWND